jgi:hypothetical protein
MFRNLATYLALTSILVAAFACGSDDGGGGPVATGGTSGGGGTTTGGGGTTTGGGGVAQGGMGGLLTGGTAGSNAGGFAGAVNWGPYPAGPYGHEVGDTIADLAWEGYVNDTGQQSSDTLPYVDYGTDAMRKSGKAYGLIHISAFT